MNYKWNDSWIKELEEKDNDCYYRLCECRNVKKDILKMARLMYSYNNEYRTKEECLDRMCEWVCCWNNQFNCELNID